MAGTHIHAHIQALLRICMNSQKLPRLITLQQIRSYNRLNHCGTDFWDVLPVKGQKYHENTLTHKHTHTHTHTYTRTYTHTQTNIHTHVKTHPFTVQMTFGERRPALGTWTQWLHAVAILKKSAVKSFDLFKWAAKWLLRNTTSPQIMDPKNTRCHISQKSALWWLYIVNWAAKCFLSNSNSSWLVDPRSSCCYISQKV